MDVHARLQVAEAECQSLRQLVGVYQDLLSAYQRAFSTLGAVQQRIDEPLHEPNKQHQPIQEDEITEVEAAEAVEVDRSGSVHRTPDAQRLYEGRRLHAAGWEHIGHGRWQGRDGRTARSRREALKMLAGVQMSLPVLVPVVEREPVGSPPRDGEKVPPMPEAPPVDSLTDVAELARLWDAILNGVCRPWGPVASNQQAGLERIARADRRLRTREEWKRILWRVRASPYLMGQRTSSASGRLMVMMPGFLLDSGQSSGKPTAATRIESGQYNPEPTMGSQRGGLDGVVRPERQHLDAWGRAWDAHRCTVGCGAPGCDLEASAGFRLENEAFNPSGALCSHHVEAIREWAGERAEEAATPEAWVLLIKEWSEASKFLADSG